ncbi:MAG: glycosyltransferase family 4 protein [Anaerolineales bacterium]
MKILFFANTDWYLFNFRLALAQALRTEGYQVILVSPEGPYAARLRELGFRWLPFPLSRRGMNPFAELSTIVRLGWLYGHEKPDLVHHFTVKCVLYGSLTARLLRIKTVNSVTGLGFVFLEGEGIRRWLTKLVKVFYRFVLKGTFVIFQNPDDRAYFLQTGLVDSKQIALIRGSGVDLARFSPAPEPKGMPLVILPARLLWDKGVEDFVEAARLLRAEGAQVRFALVGDSDPENPSSIPASQLNDWSQEGVIEWWGWRGDMEQIYAQANIVCLPSYREGVPKTLLEASACGRPIVASDVPGCREVVRDGENGYLVPPHDPPAVAEALKILINDPSRRIQMGKRGREIAVNEFSAALVISETLAVYRSLVKAEGSQA